ncbi:UPF0421 protein YgaE [Paenibacillus sp. J31TS4]|uniref:FUSC family protein n=1 Tax=Paenibacillus sp. J31TS4 TaxID=2807195 RepID=UPI001AFD643C|nr:aromatic acid exporter family protein [Paenibacillus sp. J31TS4]GIP40053.1 UPF0421 protein YgaE [Paenibacillus sp. J31TS4]
MKFGARVLKTGVAVTLALYLCALFELKPPIIAAVAAIFTMLPSIYRSWRHILDQVQTNALGAILALLASQFFSSEPIAIGLVCIMVIMICLALKMESTIGLTLVTVIAIMDAPGHWTFALNRFLIILIGIFSAFVVNLVFLPPKHEETFHQQLGEVFTKLSLLLRTSISDEMKESVFREQQEELHSSISKLEEKFGIFEEEQKKLRKLTFQRIRRLVVYKQMLRTLRQGIDILDVIDRHYFAAVPTKEMDRRFDAHIEHLIHCHELVLLKYNGQLKPDAVCPEETESEMEEFLRELVQELRDDEERLPHLLAVGSAMYDYGYQLHRLDRLVANYIQHQDK